MSLLAGWRPGPYGRIRLVGAALLALLVALTGPRLAWTERQQAPWFDLLQTLQPRDPSTTPVSVIAIEKDSLAELGQWPWPRTRLAQLVQLVASAQPAAIGIDILMPEADALSPERVATQEAIADPMVIDALRRLPSHDAILARAIHDAPVVLAVHGTPDLRHSSNPLLVAPVLARAAHGTETARVPAVPRYQDSLVSVEDINKAARGWGLVTVATSRGIIRRVPLVASINGTLVPSLGLDMLRVAQHAPAVFVNVAGESVRGVSAGPFTWPTEADGSVRLYFARYDATRVVKAVSVLKDRVDLKRFRGQLVLIGTVESGLQDDEDTPIGERMSGTEIHAQLLDNLIEGKLLRRPPWAGAAEAAALALAGALLLWAVPRWTPGHAALLTLGCIAAGALASYAAFREQRLLFDASAPAAGLLLLFGLLLVMTLTEMNRQRRLLQRQVLRQRETSARLAGELQAAQRVQAATLPSPGLLAADPRIALHAVLEPAREVGGDLYDFFMLDARRLFLLVGDVAGKGLSASIFMAVSKALYKSAMLREPGAEIGAIMRTANAEVSRENPQTLFVTVFAAILDLDSGELAYCNAGHDNPWRLRPGDAAPLRITDGDGPPLCAMADYDYRGASCRLQPGELLCLTTDGVAEAQSASGELFGHERIAAVLRRMQQGGGIDVQALVEALREQVKAFVGNAEPADDLTVLALRWNGPVAAGRSAA